MAKLEPYDFREGRTKERLEIAEQYMLQLQHTFEQFRAIIDPAACGLLLHRIGIILPLLDSSSSSEWVFKNFKDLIKGILEEYVKQIHKASAVHLTMAFWGMGRLGRTCFDLAIENTRHPTGKHIYNAILERLLFLNEFGANNICNVIESLSQMKYKQRESVFSAVLRNAEEEFGDDNNNVSPVNLSYFLESVVTSQYKIEKSIINSAFENINKNMNLITLHHITKVIDAASKLEPENTFFLIKSLKQRIESRATLSKPMWNEDAVKFICALPGLNLDLDFIQPLIEYCIQFTRERIVPLNDDQEKRFKDALEKLNYALDGPLCPSKEPLDDVENMLNKQQSSFNQN